MHNRKLLEVRIKKNNQIIFLIYLLLGAIKSKLGQNIQTFFKKKSIGLLKKDRCTISYGRSIGQSNHEQHHMFCFTSRTITNTHTNILLQTTQQGYLSRILI